MLMEQHNKEMNDIADILFAMEQNYHERENDAKAEFQSMRDEIKNKVGVDSWLRENWVGLLWQLLAFPMVLHQIFSQ